jgi:hypothetical protein
MSHFSVLVVGSNVKGQLAPYHEFECTGKDDQYVQEIDQTEEALAEFNSSKVTRYRDAEGNLHEQFTAEGNYKPEFLRDPTPEEAPKVGIGSGWGDGLHWVNQDWKDGRGYRAKIFQVPEGLTEVNVPRNTVETFAEFCADYYGHEIVPFGEQPNFSKDSESTHHKYGYTIVDEQGNVVKTIDRTNPGAKWDWYSVGGRWNGFFKLKPLAVGVLGDPGSLVLANDYEKPDEDHADILMKGDIDIEGMRDEAGEKADERYDIFERVVAGLPRPLSWKQVQEKNHTGKTDEDGKPGVDWTAAREEYNAQPMVKALRDSKETVWYELEDYLCTREEYVQRFRDSALSTFAVVKDGVWYSRGDMGWWGAVSNEQERTEWNQKVSELIDSLPDNTLLTAVDCHI